MNRNYAFVHFWVKQVTDSVLQHEIDVIGKLLPQRVARKVFYVLIDEKLRRAEMEIAIL